MSKYLPDIIDAVRQVLNDEFVVGTTPDWKDDEIGVHVGLCLTEVSEASPHVVKETLCAVANSREIDISSITDLIDIEKLEYPTGHYPRKYRNFVEIDADTIEMDTTSLPVESDTLTGTVTFNSESIAVTGSGTAFEDELAVGYHIKKSTGTKWYKVYAIATDTALTLAEESLETTGADSLGATLYCQEIVYLYCNKVHTLTSSSSTLRPQEEKVLIDGASAQTALAWISGVRTQVAAAKSDLSTGRDYINTISHGGRPENDYAAYARTEGGLAGLINTYQVWANNKLALYHVGLKRLSKFQTYRTYPKS